MIYLIKDFRTSRLSRKGRRIKLVRNVNNAKEKLYLALGNTLKQLRKDNNITQAEAATCVDVDRVTISAYESGRIVPSINKMAKLARLYGCHRRLLFLLRIIWINMKSIEVENIAGQCPGVVECGCIGVTDP